MSASGHTDGLERAWLKEVEAAHYNELESPGLARFKDLDDQLAVKVPKVMVAEAKRIYDDKVVEGWKAIPVKGVSGRQCVWLILESFKINSSLNVLYSHHQLKEFPWMGDARVLEFYNGLKKMIDNLVRPMTKEELRDILFEKMSQSQKDFKLDIDQFRQSRGKAMSQGATEYGFENFTF